VVAGAGARLKVQRGRRGRRTRWRRRRCRISRRLSRQPLDKRDKAAGIEESRLFKASTDALPALAQATSERTTVALFISAEMRDTPEAVAFRRAHA